MMSLAPALFLTSGQLLAGPPLTSPQQAATTQVHHLLPVTSTRHYRTLFSVFLLPYSFILFTTHPHKHPHVQVATMSGISGHLVRRGAQMAQVHFTKVTTEQAPEHGSAPAMDFNPMDYLPSAIVAIVTVLLIASVSFTSWIATAPGRILTNYTGPLHSRRSNCLSRDDRDASFHRHHRDRATSVCRRARLPFGEER